MLTPTELARTANELLPELDRQLPAVDQTAIEGARLSGCWDDAVANLVACLVRDAVPVTGRQLTGLAVLCAQFHLELPKLQRASRTVPAAAGS